MWVRGYDLTKNSNELIKYSFDFSDNVRSACIPLTKLLWFDLGPGNRKRLLVHNKVVREAQRDQDPNGWRLRSRLLSA